MEDWEDESPSDDDIKNIENELYSMFYYHSMSEGIPEELTKKYDVDINDFGVTISLKSDSVNHDSSIKSNGLTDNKHNEEYEGKTLKEFHRRTNDRYIDGRNNNSDVLLEIQDISAAKENSEGDAIDQLATNLTEVPSIASVRNKSFHKTPRYFNEISKTAPVKFAPRSEKNVIENRRISGKNYVFNQSSENILEAHIKLPDSKSPHRSQNNFINKLDKIKNKTKNRVRAVSPDVKIIEKTYELVDLTEGADGNKSNTLSKKRKNKKHKLSGRVPVITISSESESDSEHHFEFSNETESDYNTDESFEDPLSSIVLNTSLPTYSLDCGVEINSDYNWKETSSPEGWTKSMRRFYNKPSKELIKFDYNIFLKDIKNKGDDWSICSADRLSYKRKRQIRCLRCHQEGHVKAKCTKVFSCHMCGTPGHEARMCPRKICLKCGTKRKDGFFMDCSSCINEEDTVCNFCGIQGHPPNLCTDAWRSFKSIEEVSIQNRSLKYCCNCAKSGHTVDNCRKKMELQQTPNRLGKRHTDTPTPGKRKFKGQLKRSYRESDFPETTVLLPSKNKKFKFKLHSAAANYRDIIVPNMMSPTNKRKMKRHVSKRIHMLRKSNKKKKFKPCLSATI